MQALVKIIVLASNCKSAEVFFEMTEKIFSNLDI